MRLAALGDTTCQGEHGGAVVVDLGDPWARWVITGWWSVPVGWPRPEWLVVEQPGGLGSVGVTSWGCDGQLVGVAAVAPQIVFFDLITPGT